MKKIRNYLIIVTLIILSFGTGFNFGKSEKKAIPVKSETVRNNDKSQQKGLDFTMFWEVWDRLYLYYLEKDSLDPQKMIYGAVSGMVSSLDDPYTVFLSPDQNKEAKDDLGGKFEGIGAQLGVKDKKIVVVAPLKKSPAEVAGIQPGDVIIKVDGKETITWTLPQAVSNIRGPRGSKVLLTILHKNEDKSKEISVLRDEINVPSIEWETINVKCQKNNDKDAPQCIKESAECLLCLEAYYLKLSRFGDTTSSEWTKAIGEIVQKISKTPKHRQLGIVFDVRNNPGGYLSGSVFIASEFLKDGTIVIQQSGDGSKKTYKVNREGKFINTPLVMLVNKGSASASEIVAGALKVRKNISLIGEATFGKGTIQEAQDLTEGAGIHITTAKWLLPDGTNINGEGLKPDTLIENDPEKADEDKQLDKAVDILFLKK